MTVNYTTQADAFSRRVQWLVEIDFDVCTNTYTVGPCAASDAATAETPRVSGCHYSFGTCQDQTNFTKGKRTLRFCLNEVPWADPAYPVFPYLTTFVDISQQVTPSKLFGYPEQIRVRMAKDYRPMPLDQDKYSGANKRHNTATTGEFWGNLFARNRNYPGRVMRVLRGFAPVGGGAFVLADFSQVGPDYKLTKVQFEKDTVLITAESPLAELNKKKIPFTISEDNVVQNAPMTAGTTTLSVVDTREFPDPADYTLNNLKCYLEIESEIVKIDSITNGTSCEVTRAAFGTSAGSHAAGSKIKHVCCFGTDPGGATEGDNVVDVLRELLEWAGIAAGRVAGTGFARVKAMAWPRANIKRIVRKPKTVAKLLQPIRETRGIMVYINSAGNWSCTAFAPNNSTTSITDDNLVFDSVDTLEDEEDRLTRVEFWYDPTDPDDAGDDPKDYTKGVIVIDTDLEGANSFNDVRQRVVVDPWTDPDAAVGDVKLIAKRLITRLRHGTRVVSFGLDLKDNAVDVGDHLTLTSRQILNRDGNPDPRPVIVTARKQRGMGQSNYEAVDVNYGGRFMRIAPNTVAETYDTATDADKQYGYWGNATTNRVGTVADEGYIFW